MLSRLGHATTSGMSAIVRIDGRFVSEREATVSVFDRGFLYGDSVYEVIRTYEGIPFELSAHLDRLVASAAHIGMTLPVERDVLVEDVHAVLERMASPAVYIRLIVTRGGGPIGLDPALAAGPLRVVIALPLAPPTAEQYERGVNAVIPAVRRNLPTAIDPKAKTGNYLNSILALAAARKRDAYEAIMLDHRGLVTEGSTSNIFAVLGDRLVTPALDVGLLAGITRSVILRIAERAQLRAIETPLSANTLYEADEVMLSSTVRELLAVVQIDGQSVGTGQPGPAYARLRAAFAAYVAEHNA